MKIALDYDKTYTLDPIFWDKFICDAQQTGHEVYCVTSRIDNPKNRVEVYVPNVKVFFCGFASKIWYMREQQGIEVDIWVDDDPAVCAFGKNDNRPTERKRVATSSRAGFFTSNRKHRSRP